ncbi:alpha/beta fold hydrolase [Telmatospirillum siberiense]|uniref:Poly-beta-hydroxybutyrate polymerase n=1 Tax=Telmatospirillum siberiense TaxID=382514 RepID=A0A2N3PPH5_9PROT|nr:alpha/beta fold hydrolase [Telmatospirillum siberiense]PKU22288.1 poly-beta-hydroxybutyrate polymerase [Telmatospirillum siberiense]
MSKRPPPPQLRPRPRLGPRPLPQHLALLAWTMLSSQLVLPSWKNGSFGWKPHLRPAAEEMRPLLGKLDDKVFQRALMAEGIGRIAAFLAGVEAYRRHPYRRSLAEPPVIWQEGTTRLLDYGASGAGGVPVLVIPSLINRAYVLDLTARRSFLRHLAGRGMRPFLVDWDAPGAGEAAFGLEDYIAGRLGRILDVVTARAGPPVIAGYCMGGLLALGLASLRRSDVRGLLLLATPWDFHAPSARQSRMVEHLRSAFEDAIRLFGGLPTDFLQALFATIEPYGVIRKFITFGHFAAGEGKARDFVALEDWLNDGVPLVAAVARQCLFEWYGDNLPAKGEWTLLGQPVLPQTFDKPCFSLIPEHDRIVPPESALALAGALPNGRHLLVPLGHIGMMVGSRALAAVFAPAVKWLSSME